MDQIRKFRSRWRTRKLEAMKQKAINDYLKNGRLPWSRGYKLYRQEFLEKVVNDQRMMDTIRQSGQFPAGYAIGLDERAVEYIWALAHLPIGPARILDAGSSLNHPYLVTTPKIKEKELYIQTYHPEPLNFNEQSISYIYGDLRKMVFQNDSFDHVVSISTIEHIDMDNSMYGYEAPRADAGTKSFEYLRAVDEMHRVLKPGGTLLLTFPYGSYEQHGFFQQFDAEMVGRIEEALRPMGNINLTYYLYSPEGWALSDAKACAGATSHNPHTGLGKGNDGAAHSRSICCIQFIKH